MKSIIALLLLFTSSISLFGQAKRVLFIGNSYTDGYDLPNLFKDAANSCGDSVIVARSTGGGFTLEMHCQNQTTLDMIMQGGWDYVVIQEQSQRPAFSDNQVSIEVYPYAKTLDSLVNAYSECAETIFYMTWGRENGDAQNCQFFPPVCTYNGMDSLLRLRYTIMAQDNDAIIAPVGPIRRYLRNNLPNIDIYEPDGSHPTAQGAYAAACGFYAVIFQKDPAAITYYPNSISSTEATALRNAAKLVAYDSLDTWLMGNVGFTIDFDFTVNDRTVTFNNNSTNAFDYEWHFGDGTTDNSDNPIHTYDSNGIYTVTLKAKGCNGTDSITKTITIGELGIEDVMSADAVVYPNPVVDILTIEVPSYWVAEIALTGIEGRSIPVSMTQENHKISIDMSTLASGIYILKLNYNGQQLHRKILKP